MRLHKDELQLGELVNEDDDDRVTDTVFSLVVQPSHPEPRLFALVALFMDRDDKVINAKYALAGLPGTIAEFEYAVLEGKHGLETGTFSRVKRVQIKGCELTELPAHLR